MEFCAAEFSYVSASSVVAAEETDAGVASSVALSAGEGGRPSGLTISAALSCESQSGSKSLHLASSFLQDYQGLLFQKAVPLNSGRCTVRMVEGRKTNKTGKYKRDRMAIETSKNCMGSFISLQLVVFRFFFFYFVLNRYLVVNC